MLINYLVTIFVTYYNKYNHYNQFNKHNKNQAMPRMIAASPVTKEKLESELRIMQVELNRNLTMDEFLNELLGRYQAKKV